MNMSKYAIVTGVSSGIGECIANCFIEEGVHVFGIDENIPKNNKVLSILLNVFIIFYHPHINNNTNK